MFRPPVSIPLHKSFPCTTQPAGNCSKKDLASLALLKAVRIGLHSAGIGWVIDNPTGTGAASPAASLTCLAPGIRRGAGGHGFAKTASWAKLGLVLGHIGPVGWRFPTPALELCKTCLAYPKLLIGQGWSASWPKCRTRTGMPTHSRLHTHTQWVQWDINDFHCIPSLLFGAGNHTFPRQPKPCKWRFLSALD